MNSFKDNHMAFAAKRFEEIMLIPTDDCVSSDSIFKSLKIQQPKGKLHKTLPPVASANPIDRLKSENGSLSPLRSMSSSPVSVKSVDSPGVHRHTSLRRQVSLTRNRLISASSEIKPSCVPVASAQILKELTTSSEDSTFEGKTILPLWTSETEDVAAEEEEYESKQKFFTSPAKSKIHLLMCISSQRSLLGEDYLYNGEGEMPASFFEDEDDAIDHSLKKTCYDDNRLDVFLMTHRPPVVDINIDMETLDTVSDYTDDDDLM